MEIRDLFWSLPAIALLLVFLFFLFKNPKKTTLKLPPGPPTLPIIGNLHQMASPLPHKKLKDLADKYGPLMHLKLGEISTVVISSSRLTKEFMQTHGLNFADRPQTVIAKIMMYNCSGVTLSMYGDYWRKLRQIYVTELLNTKSVQSFSSIMEEELILMVKSIESEVGKPMELIEKIRSYLFDTLCRSALGKIHGKGKETLIEISREMVALSGVQTLEDIFPSVKLFSYLNPLRPKAKKLFKRLDSVLEDIINQQENKLLSLKDGDNQQEKEEDNMLSVLLRLRNGKDSKVKLTNNDIKAIIFELFVGGISTSSTTIEWAMSELMKNPEMMEKGKHEVRQVLKGKKRVCQIDVENMSYIKLVLKETLRFHPPGPLLFPRKSREQCEIDGYTIPAKAMILINNWVLGRDPEYWVDPEKFEPERFKDNLVDYKGNHFELIPFGVGRRICPGISFAVTNIELLLAALLFHFDWKLPHGMDPKDLDMIELYRSGCTRKNPLVLIPKIYIPTGDENY
ncbi:hypothetical protein M9H77_24359 [Catharanthus roseus]|uniref:Uncharacterized protein n=1 Tax=Catharanthus roseus TaxID=4058 RepID=A0ACC0AW94_CATRO|nr:hypothetical protein M9H77_24359 [Catharanthus roseus]